VTRLSYQAEGQGQKRNGGNSPTNDESVWFDAFEPTAERAFQKILHLRTRLSGTNCEFKFFWPNHAEEYDLEAMQTEAGVPPNMKANAKRKVAFTTFPGLQVTATDLGVKSTFVAYKAFVKLYPYTSYTD
jgi:hypothetical protein